MVDERRDTTSPPPVAAPTARAIVALSDAECRTVLERQRLCVVSVVDDGAPYAVPVYYGFDGTDIFLGVAEGRKTRALDVNPRVHLTVTEVGPGDAWRSVAVAGRAQALTDADERQRGIDALIAHHRRFRDRDTTEQSSRRRPRGGRVLRIEQVVLTGRSFAG